MISPYQDIETLKRLMKMLSVQFGPKTELVLHDLTSGYESTIIAIENNTITGREVGSCGSNLGLEILRSGKKSDTEDCFGYTINLKDGRVIRSSSLYFRDDNDKLIGALCINTDITSLKMMNDYMEPLLPADNSQDDVEEVFAHNIGELLDYYIEKCNEQICKDAKLMTKEDKLDAIRYFDSKGVFLITKAGSKICKYLNISKGTLYSYLDTVREAVED
ncbi:helix-turn-helix transcriptional regulator [Oscillospiraceae bacterium PP1C4]